jgi:hypothetical protein
MTTKTYNCWGCKYFLKNSSPTAISGYCRRHAPHGLDAVGLDGAYDTRKNQCGNIGADIIIGGAGQLYRSGDATIGLPTVPASGGFNDNGCFPFPTVAGEDITEIHMNFSLLNVGTDNVAEYANLLMNFVSIADDTSTVIEQLQIPIPQASVGVAGNTTDNFYQRSYFLADAAFQMPVLNWGVQFDLSETEDDRIAEIRNPNVCIITRANIGIYGSVAKFAAISDGLTMFCGEYCRNDQPVPDPPVVE